MTPETEGASDTNVRPSPQRGSFVLWGLVVFPLLLVGAGALFVSGSFDDPPAIVRVGGNLPVNGGAIDPGDQSAHSSPTIVRNPRDAANLAIANRIDNPEFSCALHISLDGGSSWRQTPLPVPPGEQAKCYAPDVAFDASGKLYLSFVTLQGRGNVPNAVWIASSDDGGVTLSEPRQALGKLAFQVRLSADPSDSGRLYLTWLQASGVGLYKFTAPGNPIRSMRSDDGGRVWSSPVDLNDPERERVLAPSTVVGPDGDVYVVYLDVGEDVLDYEGAHEGQGGPPYEGTFELVLSRSTDEGQTWEESVVEDEIIPSERFIVFLPPFPSLALDPEQETVHVAFHDSRLGDADVWLWTSEDDGNTWGEAVRVNDTQEKDGTTQHLPQLAVAPGGRVDVAYYDRRSDDDDVRSDVSFQSSFDGGASFESALRMTDRPFDSSRANGSERGMPDLGSRLGLLSTDERSLGVWGDTRSASEGSGKQDLVQTVVEISGEEGLPPWAKLWLQAGGALALAAAVAVALWGFSRRRRRPAGDASSPRPPTP